MAISLGSLAVKISSTGLPKTIQGIVLFQKRFTQLQKKIGPLLKKLTARFKKFGLIAGGMFASLIAASPLLRARMEILSLRVQELVRVFGDALGPVIEGVTDLVKLATDAWNSLPEPLQNAILFGVQVVAVLGLLALAWVAVSIAMSPVTLAILAIVAAMALIYLIFTEDLLGIRTSIENVIGAITGIFEGFLSFIANIFSLNISGALQGIVKIFQSAFDLIIAIIMTPITAIQKVIDFFLGFEFIADMIAAGQAIVDAFIKGMQDAWDASVGVVHDIMDGVGEFFGGSLPERGPLKHVVSWGEELGEEYIQGITRGVSGNISHIDRSLHIDRLEMTVPGADLEGSEQLFGELNKVRKARAW